MTFVLLLSLPLSLRRSSLFRFSFYLSFVCRFIHHISRFGRFLWSIATEMSQMAFDESPVFEDVIARDLCANARGRHDGVQRIRLLRDREFDVKAHEVIAEFLLIRFGRSH